MALCWECGQERQAYLAPCRVCGAPKDEPPTVPTADAYEAACRALAHWRKEAKRLGRLAGTKPREMKP